MGVHRHDDVLETRRSANAVEQCRNQILTDGKISAKSAAFARVLPHIQRTADGKPTKDVQRDATPWGK